MEVKKAVKKNIRQFNLSSLSSIRARFPKPGKLMELSKKVNLCTFVVSSTSLLGGVLNRPAPPLMGPPPLPRCTLPLPGATPLIPGATPLPPLGTVPPLPLAAAPLACEPLVVELLSLLPGSVIPLDTVVDNGDDGGGFVVDH